MKEQLLGVFIGFITFFLYPMFEFYVKRRYSKNVGNPELWYLPSFGFRLVIRNIPNNINLFDLKYKTILRKIVSSNSGSSVSTLQDEVLVNSEELFLISGYDQVIVSFQLKIDNNNLYFILTDKLGVEKSKHLLDSDSLIVCDYKATIDNKFHFDVPVGRRIVIKKETLIKTLQTIQNDNTEQRFELNKIIKIS
jgi:hypothetical protein